jgi:hypothetical protein
MKNIVLFEKLNAVQSYKLKYSLFLTMVPMFTTLILVVQLFIFSMLNLYYLEGNGLIVDEQVREAYYHQVIGEVIPMSIYVLFIIIANFALGYVVLSWAVSPFVCAEKKIRGFTGKNIATNNANHFLSENSLIDAAVNSFLSELETGKRHPELDNKAPLFKLSVSFLARYLAIFAFLSVMTGYALGLLLNVTFMKVVSLALNVAHGQVIRGHFFTAQSEVLELGVTISIITSIMAYLFIGYIIAKYMSTMVMVFHRAFQERRFPIHLRKTDIYQSLAEAINEKAKLSAIHTNQ